MSLNSLVCVKHSLIHGKGLFAKVDIPKNKIIGQITGTKSSKPTPYTLWLDEQNAIDVQGLLKYINHSNKPNACYYDDLTVVAIANIKKEDEITHNYGDDWE